jgi:dihydropteroate synthase
VADADTSAGPDVGFVAMHMLGDPRTMQQHPTYDDVVTDVAEFLVRRADAAVAAGVQEVWIDPGIGFGKTAPHNWSLLRHLDVLVGTGYPVLLGTSRKRFLGLATALSDGGRSDGAADGDLVPVTDRLEASLATAVWAMVQGVRMVRVHDVRATVHAAVVVSG